MLNLILAICTAITTSVLIVWLFSLYVKWSADQYSSMSTSILLAPKYLADSYKVLYFWAQYYQARYL